MADLILIAWRNIGRNRRRSILSALAVAFAVALLIFSMAFQRGSYANMIYNTVHARTGHLQVQHEAHWPNQSLSKAVARPNEILDAIAEIPEVEAAAPRIQTAALISSEERTFGAFVQGIDAERERNVSTLASMVREGSFLDPEDETGALVGAQLADNLGVGLGDEIVFLGQGADGSMAAGMLTVRGLVKTGFSDVDRAMIAAPLISIQQAFSLEDAATEIVVLLDRDDQRPMVASAIRDRLESLSRSTVVVHEWTTLMPGVEESIRIDWYSGLVIYFVLVVVVGFGIANTFLMAFMERIREFGVLLSLGMAPGRISFMVYTESVLLTVLGVMCGLGIGVPLVLLFEWKGISFGEAGGKMLSEYGMSPIIYPELSALVLQWAVGIVLAVSLALAIYPAWKASRLLPVEALRHA